MNYEEIRKCTVEIQEEMLTEKWQSLLKEINSQGQGTNEKSNSTNLFSKIKFLSLKNLGIIQEKSGCYEVALNAYVNACEIDSNDLYLWIRIGSCSLECNKYRLCKFAFEKGLSLSPSNIICQQGLLDINFILEDYNECKNILRICEKDIYNSIRTKYYLKEKPQLNILNIEINKENDENSNNLDLIKEWINIHRESNDEKYIISTINNNNNNTSLSSSNTENTQNTQNTVVQYVVQYTPPNISIYSILHSLIVLYGYLYRNQDYILDNNIQYNIINTNDGSKNELLNIIQSINYIGISPIFIDINELEYDLKDNYVKKIEKRKVYNNNNNNNEDKNDNLKNNNNNKRKRNNNTRNGSYNNNRKKNDISISSMISYLDEYTMSCKEDGYGILINSLIEEYDKEKGNKERKEERKEDENEDERKEREEREMEFEEEEDNEEEEENKNEKDIDNPFMKNIFNKTNNNKNKKHNKKNKRRKLNDENKTEIDTENKLKVFLNIINSEDDDNNNSSSNNENENDDFEEDDEGNNNNNNKIKTKIIPKNNTETKTNNPIIIINEDEYKSYLNNLIKECNDNNKGFQSLLYMISESISKNGMKYINIKNYNLCEKVMKFDEIMRLCLDINIVSPNWDVLYLLFVLNNYEYIENYNQIYHDRIAILESKLNNYFQQQQQEQQQLCNYSNILSSYWYIKGYYFNKINNNNNNNNQYDITYYKLCKNEYDKNGMIENSIWSIEEVENVLETSCCNDPIKQIIDLLNTKCDVSIPLIKQNIVVNENDEMNELINKLYNSISNMENKIENNYENIIKLELCNNKSKNHSLIEYVLFVLNIKQNYQLLFNFFVKLIKFNTNYSLLEEIIKYFINNDYQVVWNKLNNDELMILFMNMIESLEALENDESDKNDELFTKLFSLLFKYFNINNNRNNLFNSFIYFLSKISSITLVSHITSTYIRFMLDNSIHFEDNINEKKESKKNQLIFLLYSLYMSVLYKEMNINITYNILVVSVIYTFYNKLIIIKEDENEDNNTNNYNNSSISNTITSFHNIIHDMKYCYKNNYIFNVICLDYLLLKQKKCNFNSNNNNNNVNLYSKSEKLCILQLFDCIFQWKVFLKVSLDEVRICKISYPIAVFIYPFIEDIMRIETYTKNDIKTIYKSLYHIYPHDSVINDDNLVIEKIMKCERIDNGNNGINIKNINDEENQIQNLNEINSIASILFNNNNNENNCHISLNQYIISLPHKIDEVINSSIPKISNYITVLNNNNNNNNNSNNKEVEYKYINDVRVLIRLYLEILTFKTDDFVTWNKLTQAYIELFFYCVNFESNLFIPLELYKSENKNRNTIPYLDGFNQIVEINTNIKKTIEFYFNHSSYCFTQTNIFFPKDDGNIELKINHFQSAGFFNYCVSIKSFNILDSEEDRNVYFSKSLECFKIAQKLQNNSPNWDLMLFIVKCNKRLKYKNNYLELYKQYYKCIEQFEKNISSIDNKERDRDLSFILYFFSSCGLKLISSYCEIMKIDDITKTKDFDEDFLKSLELLPSYMLTSSTNRILINNSICLECGNSFNQQQQQQQSFIKCQLCGVIYHLQCYYEKGVNIDSKEAFNLYCKNCEVNKSKKYWNIYRVLMNCLGVIKYSLQLNQYNSRSTYLLMELKPKLWKYVIQIYPKYSILEKEFYNYATSLLLSKKKRVSEFKIYRYDNSNNLLDKLDYHQKKYQRALFKYLLMTIIYLKKHNDYYKLISLYSFVHTNYDSQKLFDSLNKSILSSLKFQFEKSNDLKSIVDCLKNYNQFRSIVSSNPIVAECNKDMANVIDVLNSKYKCNIGDYNRKTIEKFLKCYDKENTIQNLTQ